MLKKHTPHFSVKDMATVSMCVAIIAISSWLTIPFAVNFTLQTFAIFVICAIFELKISWVSVFAYILIGVCGLPVFSGFGAGISAILGPTGGYLAGFLLIPPVMRFILRNKRKNIVLKLCSMLVGLIFCYLFGTLWYYLGYSAGTDLNFLEILCLCVFPFIIPDMLKIVLATYISNRLDTLNSK